jgi:hypothetical protein
MSDLIAALTGVPHSWLGEHEGTSPVPSFVSRRLRSAIKCSE